MSSLAEISLSLVRVVDLRLFYPEIGLILAILGLMFAELFLKRVYGCKAPSARTAAEVLRARTAEPWLTKKLLLLVLAVSSLSFIGCWLWQRLGHIKPLLIFNAQLAIDPFSDFFKLLFIGIALIAVLSSFFSAELREEQLGEYYILLLSLVLGLFIMSSAHDLLMVYLGLELVSLTSYALSGYKIADKRSSEASLKYLVYGSAASGLMLFGMSLFYGLFGSTNFTNLVLKNMDFAVVPIGAMSVPWLLIVSLGLIFVGLAYKLALVPFHMWAPDVYEGSPMPVAGFLTVAPKVAGFALLLRFYNELLLDSPLEPALAGLFGIMAALSMIFGNLGALLQDNLKRLLAYSTIAHAGYILMVFTKMSKPSLQAVLFYLVVYYLMNMGAFVIAQAIRDHTGSESLASFKGLAEREPFLAICMAIFLFALTGLPPLSGFIAKFYLFAAILESPSPWLVLLVVIAALNTVVSLFYYVRVVRLMFLQEATTSAPLLPLRISLKYVGLVVLLAVPTLGLGVYFAPLTRFIQRSLGMYKPSGELNLVAVEKR